MYTHIRQLLQYADDTQNENSPSPMILPKYAYSSKIETTFENMFNNKVKTKNQNMYLSKKTNWNTKFNIDITKECIPI